MRCLSLILLFFILQNRGSELYSQTRFRDWLTPGTDSLYVKIYPDVLVARLYGSRKHSDNYLADFKNNTLLSIRPSNGYNAGVGLTYRYLTLNIALPIRRLVPDEDLYGKTKRLDLQFHLFLRRFTIDFYTGYFKNQYLVSKDKPFFTTPLFPGVIVQPELTTYTLGTGIYTNFNARKFSTGAAFLQNERQVRSAGTPIAGVEIYWNSTRNNQPLIPQPDPPVDFFNRQNFIRFESLSLGIAGGYAYTAVIGKRLFATLSLTVSGGAGIQTLGITEGESRKRAGLQLGSCQRFAVGYNWGALFTGIAVSNFYKLSPTEIQAGYTLWNPGILRINCAYRIPLKKNPLPRFLQFQI